MSKLTTSQKKLFKRWRVQRKLVRKKLQFEYIAHNLIPGTDVLFGFIRDCPYPIGSIWYCHSGLHQLEILHSYVIDWARLCGVRTLLHKEMIRAYPKCALTTAEANKHSKRWLIKQGFKLKRRGWVLKR